MTGGGTSVEDSRGFSREDVLAVEGELRLSFAGLLEDDDRILIGKIDLHDLLASQFAGATENMVYLGRFRVVFERVG